MNSTAQRSTAVLYNTVVATAQTSHVRKQQYHFLLLTDGGRPHAGRDNSRLARPTSHARLKHRHARRYAIPRVKVHNPHPCNTSPPVPPISEP